MKLLWLDIETTGLNPTFDPILSLGMVLTEAELVPVIAWQEWDVHHEQLPPLDAWCTKTHGESGLLERVKASSFSWHDVRVSARNWLDTHAPDRSQLFIAGTNVHFDVAFLRAQAPELLKGIDYHLLDVGTLKLAAKAWAPWLAAQLAQFKGGHTPLTDLGAALKQTARFREALRFAGGLEADNRLLEAALKRYGQHEDQCQAGYLTADRHEPGPCTCGLAEALSGEHPAPTGQGERQK